MDECKPLPGAHSEVLSSGGGAGGGGDDHHHGGGDGGGGDDHQYGGGDGGGDDFDSVGTYCTPAQLGLEPDSLKRLVRGSPVHISRDPGPYTYI